jgi:hypothetical protein
VFDCDISILTPSQREKLRDMHYTESGGIPLRLYLRMPEFDITTKQIILKGPSALSILKIRVPASGSISETGENQGGFPWKKSLVFA